MRQSAVSFKAKGLDFEGIVAEPEGVEGPFPAVVICHPHPLFGGSMDNNVVVALAFGLVQEGFVTLRFNFRGVGNSGGEHSKGEKEFEETLGALDLMAHWRGVNDKKLGVIGYSFGSAVVGRHSQLHRKAHALALVSPSLETVESEALQKSKAPVFIITGGQDKLAQSERWPAVLDSFAQPPACQVVEGADHFWSGQEGTLSRHISQFFVEHLT